MVRFVRLSIIGKEKGKGRFEKSVCFFNVTQKQGIAKT